jgi:hypothetical protein
LDGTNLIGWSAGRVSVGRSCLSSPWSAPVPTRCEVSGRHGSASCLPSSKSSRSNCEAITVLNCSDTEPCSIKWGGADQSTLNGNLFNSVDYSTWQSPL